MLSLLRMLVKNKDIILMDEPFSSIDKQNAGMLYKQILSVQEKTIIMVTHDISNEVLNLFDVVIKMEKGKVISQDHSKE